MSFLGIKKRYKSSCINDSKGIATYMALHGNTRKDQAITNLLESDYLKVEEQQDKTNLQLSPDMLKTV